VETKKEQKVGYRYVVLANLVLIEPCNIIQSTYQAIVDIIKREGALGLYSGLSSSLLGIAVTNGCVLEQQQFERMIRTCFDVLCAASITIFMNGQGKQFFAQGRARIKRLARRSPC